ncbi:SidA/IucD/PvdA family monooxygenase [uncultured Ruegeria sp.]|uniref:SidA/IucD/PvdA family monooxygenase n=1 Tax=uncultured Ruegeria sp. TaxID=259304 RepID=UPI00261C942C|nr:SidA/IucD/PvdA family monooxygenase [uncultured Ruegeria sp.]
MAKSILIVGAGAKAAAIAAKHRALLESEFEVPDITVIEKHEVSANWNGRFGYTDGIHNLGTPPEKDIGFPYRLDYFDAKVIRYLFSHFSWQSFCIEKRCDYGDWIDRGKQHPNHETWSEYLAWVLGRSNVELFANTTIEKITQKDGRWKVSFKNSNRNREEYFDGIVFTGPGPAKHLGIEFPLHPSVLDGASYWQNTYRLAALQEQVAPVVIVGGGETAASIASSILDETRNKNIPIIILTRSGTIFSRGEGYYENRMFTDPERWRTLDIDVRREVIRRGDRGVFSVDALQKISHSQRIEHINGAVSGIDIDQPENLINLQLSNGTTVQCQMLVMSVGFDNYWFRDLFSESVSEKFFDRSNTNAIEENLLEDTSVDFTKPPFNEAEEYPRLHLPMSAALAQGPGLPNLSCLGTLSDLILRRYCRAG